MGTSAVVDLPASCERALSGRISGLIDRSSVGESSQVVT